MTPLFLKPPKLYTCSTSLKVHDGVNLDVKIYIFLHMYDTLLLIMLPILFKSDFMETEPMLNIRVSNLLKIHVFWSFFDVLW